MYIREALSRKLWDDFVEKQRLKFAIDLDNRVEEFLLESKCRHIRVIQNENSKRLEEFEIVLIYQEGRYEFLMDELNPSTQTQLKWSKSSIGRLTFDLNFAEDKVKQIFQTLDSFIGFLMSNGWDFVQAPIRPELEPETFVFYIYKYFVAEASEQELIEDFMFNLEMNRKEAERIRDYVVSLDLEKFKINNKELWETTCDKMLM